MESDLSQFNQEFFAESAEHVATVEEGLLQIERRPNDRDLLDRIFRAAHSIKGVAGMLGFTDVMDFTHKMETLLDKLRHGTNAPGKPIVDLLLQATDGLKALLAAAEGREAADRTAIAALVARLEAAAQAPVIESPARPAPPDEAALFDGKAGLFEPAASPVPTVHDQAGQPVEPSQPPKIGEILIEQGVVTKDAVAAALAEQVRHEDKRIGEILVEQRATTPQHIEQALEKQQQQAAAAKKAEASSIRVDTDKIDKLINLVGELVITQSMLSEIGARFAMPQLPILRERIGQLERTTREIQERVMAIRMLPIGTVFNRFPRLVRDLAAKNGKRIQLLISGEDTELDKTVIESIGDPLTHLVRNSADHGLEPPEERRKAGKPEQGTITMNAYHEGGNICITVGDDGRGLCREKILAKAIQQGLVGEHDKLTDEQVWPLIFKPGFSTAEKVTDVSGRGVGMDVVKRNIEALGGTVAIKTQAGEGTTFTLKLPLTLAIIEGMTVRVGRELYIVPLVSVIESLQPKPDQVKTVVGRGELVNVRGTYHPIVRLADVFGAKADCSDPTKALLMIVEAEGERVALMVDELLGHQQVVIKSLERNFRKVNGIAGATILGDGTVGVILDIRGVIVLSRRGYMRAA